MTFKRRNGGRNKHGRGHVKFIHCSNYGKCCPKVMDMKESVVPLSSPAPPAPRRSVTKSQGQQVNLAQASASASAAEPPFSGSNAIENGNNQEGEADGYSIYIKGLPLNATLALLENEFKRFGQTKTVSS